MNDFRTPLARVRGHGSAHEGSGHWWVQRLTSVALVPLSLWMVASIVALKGADHATFQVWLSHFGNALMMVLFIIISIHHMVLGMQVIIEDYVNSESFKFAAIILTHLGSYLLGVACVLAVIGVAFGG
ncbi:succinate dehydrogenase, hydrophobic membrane anchor protein [Magnetospira sp. QH-2]|uniref:succinate dehydrogenase, hydrophobic membrane anchor protein n=1 Tax=Magnetospira sp. (strain QH-2) TaxID=1288970 RepID=UPI0003E815AD|nr:succinate dehydrogenase, hydrophobic membrane anchor protein [Magnetospira sp. QH-2]CCQ75022.1 Succinate dehydrogenase hydrophobic membrane anchor subunit [Magnetospira sp. QH-2]